MGCYFSTRCLSLNMDEYEPKQAFLTSPQPAGKIFMQKYKRVNAKRNMPRNPPLKRST